MLAELSLSPSLSLFQTLNGVCQYSNFKNLVHSDVWQSLKLRYVMTETWASIIQFCNAHNRTHFIKITTEAELTYVERHYIL